MTEVSIGAGPEGGWYTRHQICPKRDCGKSIILLQQWEGGNAHERLVFPKNVARNPLPPELDDAQVAGDYNEASLVLTDSPKASAALSRRCLQYILRQKAGIKRGNLSDEIQQALDSGNLPSDIAENLDAVRNIGNFAAHLEKSTSTGEVVEVEPNEAEWNLDVLEQLIDFYYVRPAMSKKKREELNAKLAAAGKPPLK